ncbi:hypothetical protein Rsub_09694 [Raphidocelis subcapitata]|uniref:Uncharacterized protein n=1 Tax=Raphidocelis subcapitata TaxID=307507 RepID=A0A2V0PAF6_9CHLO|nr:hypothetical protein Rsub_09694 [Raphidocelis subcapitata]|eukprot:GBF96838.1 hypothetical protein Rsub_09694 [Raphidocelis subcapitata]
MLAAGALAVGAGAALLAIFADPVPPERVREHQESNFRWALMGGISFFPLFNWLAWVLAALEDEANARLYYWFAGLYALPLLVNGFDQDAFSIALLLTGAVHVQAARIAATEPELQAKIARALSPLSVVKTVARAAAALFRALLPGPAPPRGTGAGSGGSLPAADGGREWGARVAGGAEKTRSEELQAALLEQELRDFDERLRERDAGRRGGGGGGGGGGGRSGGAAGAGGGDDGW